MTGSEKADDVNVEDDLDHLDDWVLDVVVSKST